VYAFDKLEDKNLIFRNGPYFMGPQGMYLNKWSRNFSQYPLPISFWVHLPHLPLHCWNPKSLEAIGNNLRKYIDKDERKEQYSCERICMEVDLEVGLPEYTQLKVADWSYIKELDYEQLSFKCRYFHGYGHFAQHCKKKAEEEVENLKENQWTQVQKESSSKINNRSKGKGSSKGPNAPTKGNSLRGRKINPPNPRVFQNPLRNPQQHSINLRTID
jgi:hypothetical protein